MKFLFDINGFSKDLILCDAHRFVITLVRQKNLMLLLEN